MCCQSFARKSVVPFSDDFQQRSTPWNLWEFSISICFFCGASGAFPSTIENISQIYWFSKKLKKKKHQGDLRSIGKSCVQTLVIGDPAIVRPSQVRHYLLQPGGVWPSVIQATGQLLLRILSKIQNGFQVNGELTVLGWDSLFHQFSPIFFTNLDL